MHAADAIAIKKEKNGKKRNTLTQMALLFYMSRPLNSSVADTRFYPLGKLPHKDCMKN